MGMTSSVPWSTSDPCWFHSVICGEMVWSWLIRATTWRGPNTSFCLGNSNTRKRP